MKPGEDRIDVAADRHAGQGGDQPRLRDDARRGHPLRAADVSRVFATEDQKEGMAAFAEKRKPQFRNR